MKFQVSSYELFFCFIYICAIFSFLYDSKLCRAAGKCSATVTYNKRSGLNLHSGCCSSMLHAVIWYSTYLDCQTTSTALFYLLLHVSHEQLECWYFWQHVNAAWKLNDRRVAVSSHSSGGESLWINYFRTSRLWSLVHLTQTIFELKMER